MASAASQVWIMDSPRCSRGDVLPEITAYRMARVGGGMRLGADRLQRLVDRATKEAARQGHKLGLFGIEIRNDQGQWQAAVTSCQSCGEIAALDLTERPYLFGRALERKCK